ncbi:hypothetical protein GPALN_004229 [Globodera pallida]|nr:hypothetical protein GPALN_004229 [Globodera pallida]
MHSTIRAEQFAREDDGHSTPLELVHVIVEHPKQQGAHAVSFLKRLNHDSKINRHTVSSSNDDTATDARLSGGRTVAEASPTATPTSITAPQTPSHRCGCCCCCACTAVEPRLRR